MAFAISIEPDFVRITLSGVMSDADLQRIADAADEIEGDRAAVPPRLTDLRAVTELKIVYADVSRLAERRRAITFGKKFRSAILVGSPAQRGIARMFQTLNDHSKVTIEIFDDEASAVAWLKS